jgi:RimJ/RimL family protein N-acetyltransferase
MKDFPQLETSRLRLRRIQIDDIPSLVKYANNKKISDFILNLPHPYQEFDAVFRIRYVHEGFKARTRYIFAIVLKKTGEFIGEISLHLDNQKSVAELAYWIGEPLWKNGYVTEAINEILAFGFKTLNLDLITATCKEDNMASVRVLEKNGLQKSEPAGSIVEYTIKRLEYISKVHEKQNAI